MRRVAAVVAAGWLATGLTGCRRDTVRVSFRPRVGAVYRYEVRVHSERTTRLGDAGPEVTADDIVLRARQTVLRAGPGDVVVEVRLSEEGVADRTYVVRLDRAAQLAGVETVEGLPPSVLGPEGLPDILPGAPGAPPDRPLAPGERWTIDAPAGPQGAGDGRLVGSGRLVGLGLVGGRKVATTRSRTSLPLTSTTALRGSAVALDGTETTDGRATRALADGAVETASTVTRGQFAITLAPAGDDQGATVRGTLSIEVRSQTRRLR